MTPIRRDHLPVRADRTCQAILRPKAVVEAAANPPLSAVALRFITAAILLGTSGVQAGAQSGSRGNAVKGSLLNANAQSVALPGAVSKLLPEARFDATQSKLLTHPAIPFQAFTPSNIAPGRTVTPDAKGTLSNGKQITLAEYLRQRNALEQQLNQIGYTTRVKASEVVVREPVFSREALQKQSLDFKATMTAGPHTQYGPQIIQKDQTLRVESRPDTRVDLMNNLVIDPAAMQALAVRPTALPMKTGANNLRPEKPTDGGGDGPAPVPGKVAIPANKLVIKEKSNVDLSVFLPHPEQPIPLKDHRYWNWGWGNSYFGAYYNGTFDLNGQAVKPPDMKHIDTNLSEFHTATQGKIGVRLLTASTDVLGYTGNFDSSNKTKTVHVGGGVYVAGFKVWSDDRTFPQKTEAGSLWEKPFDVHTPDNLQIPVWGPFYVTGQIGIAGKAGVKYGYALNTMNVSGLLNPYIQSRVYAHGGLGIGAGGFDIAEAGLSADMLLLNDNMEVGADVGVGWLFKFYLQDHVYCYNKVDALQGHVDAYVQILAVDFLGIKIDGPRYTHKLFDWDGIHADGSLFDINHTTALNWQL